MLYALRLRIDYHFDRPAGGGRQLLRVRPADLPGVQAVRQMRLEITPPPLEARRFRDFFGTEVDELVMPAGLVEVCFDLHARVERVAKAPVPLDAPTLARLAEDLASVRGLGPASPHHYLPSSPRLPQVPQIAAFAADAVVGTVTSGERVERLGRAIQAAMTFDAEATRVDTPVAEAFEQRRGVCQDYAGIMIAGLRSLGIPAAYVAGFLRTEPPAGKPRLEGADAMHAWVRAWVGAEMGWIDYDPTNACWVDLDHIMVGFGRDYADVAPVTGMLRLDGGQSGRHSVDIAEV